MTALRTDLQIISEWIAPNTRILDLGCGDGTLLAHLSETRKINGYGVEFSIDNITTCISKGVNVIHNDIDKGLSDFDDNSFDYVVMTQAIQALHYPDRTLDEMLRVGTQGIVTFPNFGHWKCRLQLALGRMPKTRTLDREWYNTENIHLCTVYDFEDLCRAKGIRIIERTVVDHEHRSSLGMRLLPNLLGEIAIYRIERQ